MELAEAVIKVIVGVPYQKGVRVYTTENMGWWTEKGQDAH